MSKNSNKINIDWNDLIADMQSDSKLALARLKDYILVETVGVGQQEVEIVKTTGRCN